MPIKVGFFSYKRLYWLGSYAHCQFAARTFARDNSTWTLWLLKTNRTSKWISKGSIFVFFENIKYNFCQNNNRCYKLQIKHAGVSRVVYASQYKPQNTLPLNQWQKLELTFTPLDVIDVLTGGGQLWLSPLSVNRRGHQVSSNDVTIEHTAPHVWKGLYSRSALPGKSILKIKISGNQLRQPTPCQK
jgi:hypothetical protein